MCCAYAQVFLLSCPSVPQKLSAISSTLTHVLTIVTSLSLLWVLCGGPQPAWAGRVMGIVWLQAPGSGVRLESDQLWFTVPCTPTRTPSDNCLLTHQLYSNWKPYIMVFLQSCGTLCNGIFTTMFKTAQWCYYNPVENCTMVLLQPCGKLHIMMLSQSCGKWHIKLLSPSYCKLHTLVLS